MFLPVLLVRDAGLFGWVVFAVPNVVGAAAMGWVLSGPGSSERIVRDHAEACAAFSAVTIGFHVFFVLWFVPRLVGLPSAAIVFAAAAVYLLLTATRGRADLFSAAAVWVFSLAMMFAFLKHASPLRFGPPGAERAVSACWLAPVCLFGFAFCPYLDLTFHRARQALDAEGARLAFGAGFGVFFFSMIVFTLLYATTLRPWVSPDWRQQSRTILTAVVGAHMIVQAAFTLSAHARSLATMARPPRHLILLLILLPQLALFPGLAANVLPRYHGLDAGEMIYRLFMGFYGLMFPTYVWVCMVPGRGAPPTRARVRAMLLGVVVAAPMFWMGFVENRMIWLVPGVTVAVLSRYIPGSRSTGLAAAAG